MRGCAMDDKLLNQYCLDWVHWCYTRRYYIAPGGKSALAAMQPSKTGLPPNARNNPDMQFFNMALHTLADMKQHYDAMVCFNLYYVEQAGHIKRAADAMAKSLKAAHEAMVGAAPELEKCRVAALQNSAF